MNNERKIIQVNKKVRIETYNDVQNRPCAVGIWNTKPYFHYVYKTEEQRNEAVERQVVRVKEIFDAREKEKQEAKKRCQEFKEKLKVGTILSDSWGYEQTNVEFYVVVEMKGSTVTLQELGHNQVGEATSWASCHVVPNLDDKRGQPVKKVVRGQGIKIDSSVTLTLWDGRPMYKSWYA